ncbi:SAM-dependent methyltransferase [Kitasatospora mediocidica]|uniref:SAM-dependent methyltransferase n=1 Tax=Kitasatospora mediocidica TaxID=58352 RepID=UPI000689517F|nr:SAM-dependent methyltransferase [Kitasatospora mediocidica]
MSSATSDQTVPSYVDPSQPSIARVYDAFLNGTDNYEVDREVVRGVLKAAPEAADLAVENRRFLIRACRFLAQQTGVTQYLDCGSGLPTAENTHNVVQRINPDARVVYVDNDPLVLAHSRALLEEVEGAFIVSEDIFEPEKLLLNEVVRSALDWNEPIALLQMGTLHHYNGEDARTRKDVMRAYIDALPPGSYVAISHFLDPEDEYSATARTMEGMFLHSMMGSGTFSTKAELEELFNGLELVAPGLVRCADWWPDGPQLKQLNAAQRCIAGGVARKA